MSNARLCMDDTIMTVITKMAGGNPEAMRICADIARHGAEIDPENMGGMGGGGMLLNLDALGVYDSRLVILYKNVCDQNLVLMMGCVRAWQLGLLSQNDLLAAVEGTLMLDTYAVFLLVKEQLCDFGGPSPPPCSSPSQLA